MTIALDFPLQSNTEVLQAIGDENVTKVRRRRRGRSLSVADTEHLDGVDEQTLKVLVVECYARRPISGIRGAHAQAIEGAMQ